MGINDEFQPGFSGLLGDGPGMHTANKMERMNHIILNRVESSIWQLWTLVRAQGHYGPFQLETVSGYTVETFDGDGSTTEFTLSKSIPRETISGYDIRLDRPYSSGITPASCSGYLSDFSDSTNLSNTVTFTQAPPAGSDNVRIVYRNITDWPSSLNSSAYLSDATIS